MRFHTKIILHPTDFSENAAKALRVATDLLHIPKTRLMIYHVCELPFFKKPPTADELTTWQSECIQLASTKMQSYLQACFGDQQPEPLPEREITVNGSASKSILDIINRIEPYMVVMGQKGDTAVRGIALGSNSRHLLEKAHCPVLIVPADMED
jgi:nucleotide-binding universal stress UspA family protein